MNQALKWLRGTRRHVSLEDVKAWPDESVRPEAMVITQELRRAVADAVLKLPYEQRITVVLRYYLDMDEREIAEAMQCPWGTVKWRLHSAKSKLRQMLAAHAAQEVNALGSVVRHAGVIPEVASRKRLVGPEPGWALAGRIRCQRRSGLVRRARWTVGHVAGQSTHAADQLGLQPGWQTTDRNHRSRRGAHVGASSPQLGHHG